jgi:hypothetical protein
MGSKRLTGVVREGDTHVGSAWVSSACHRIGRETSRWRSGSYGLAGHPARGPTTDDRGAGLRFADIAPVPALPPPRPTTVELVIRTVQTSWREI